MARAIATACRSPPESEPIGVVGGMFLPMPTRFKQIAGDLHPSASWSIRFEEARALERLAAEEEVARDRELRDQRRVLVDRLDAVARWRRWCCGSSTFLPRTIDVAAGERHGA